MQNFTVVLHSSGLHILPFLYLKRRQGLKIYFFHFCHWIKDQKKHPNFWIWKCRHQNGSSFLFGKGKNILPGVAKVLARKTFSNALEIIVYTTFYSIPNIFQSLRELADFAKPFSFSLTSQSRKLRFDWQIKVYFRANKPNVFSMFSKLKWKLYSTSAKLFTIRRLSQLVFLNFVTDTKKRKVDVYLFANTFREFTWKDLSCLSCLFHYIQILDVI